MIISLGDKFINMDNVLYIEDETSHLPMVSIYFISKKEGLHLSGDYAEKVLTYLERTAEKPMRKKKLQLEFEDEVYSEDKEETFREFQQRHGTLGEWRERLTSR